MNEEIKQKIKKIIVSIACALSFFGAFYGAGKILIHDIPTMIRGYDYIALETDYNDNGNEIVTEEEKREVSFEDAFSDFFTNFIILSLSLGFLILYLSPKKETD